MTATVFLEVCAYFEPEFRAALREEGLSHVRLATFRGGCDDRVRGAPGATGHDGPASTPPALRIAGHCMGRPFCRSRSLNLESCFDLLLGPDSVARHLAEGAHLLTPSMLREWRSHAAALGLAPADARAFFAESCTRMLLVDGGAAPVLQTELAAYSAFTGVPVAVVSTGLVRLRRYLRQWLAMECPAPLPGSAP